MKKILIINGHPDKESFCSELARSYKRGADKSGTECNLVNLIDLKFDPILRYGYRIKTELEPDLLKIQKQIKDASHLVIVYPVWWGTYPALLKGFIDRAILPGFAFKFHEKSVMWDKYLKGKSARLIITMNTPRLFYSLVYKSPGINSMKKGILEFCGVKPVNVTCFTPIKSSDQKKRENWISTVESFGQYQK